jgi:hypothetical protein
VNHNQGKLDYYSENPDAKKDASQRNVVAEKQAKKQEQGNKLHVSTPTFGFLF